MATVTIELEEFKDLYRAKIEREFANEIEEMKRKVNLACESEDYWYKKAHEYEIRISELESKLNELSPVEVF